MAITSINGAVPLPLPAGTQGGRTPPDPATLAVASAVDKETASHSPILRKRSLPPKTRTGPATSKVATRNPTPIRSKPRSTS